jgi:hypothetical protein
MNTEEKVIMAINPPNFRDIIVYAKTEELYVGISERKIAVIAELCSEYDSEKAASRLGSITGNLFIYKCVSGEPYITDSKSLPVIDIQISLTPKGIIIFKKQLLNCAVSVCVNGEIICKLQNIGNIDEISSALKLYFKKQFNK